MADLVFNVSKGKAAELFQNVEDNDPAAAVIRIFAIDANGETDDNMRDADTMAALFALLANEVTNSGYANISLDETAITITLDDTNNRIDVDLTDQTWSAVAAGTAWTDLVIAYDPDGTDTDSGTIPLTLHDFAVTPDGSDITVQWNAAGVFRAS